MNELRIKILIIYLALLFCSYEWIDSRYSESDIKNSFIEIIPFKGIKLLNDSILIDKMTINEVIELFDTSKINIDLIINGANHLVISSLGSPPPGYKGEWKGIPDKKYTGYSATLKIDSISMFFGYGKYGGFYNWTDNMLDSLVLSNIVINTPLNAGIDNQLKLGDSYMKIFKYYGFPPESTCGKPRLLRDEYRYNGIHYYVYTDSTNREIYGKITRIMIDKRSKY